MSKDVYKVTIASGKGQPLAVVLTPHPEIVKIIRKQWSHLLGWRKSGEYQVWTQKLDPMDFIAGNVKSKRAAPKTISRSAK
jgi:hypothetical protein